MTLQLLINGTDYTARWRLYESRWSSKAWLGESVQADFLLDDFDGAVNHDDLKPRKIVEVWEDASGSPVCLYHGRIANKTLGMGPPHYRIAFQWHVLTEDFNIELRGLRVESQTRGNETDDERFEFFRHGWLDGVASANANARDSTDLGNTYIGVTPGNAVDLDPEQYVDTFPADVFQRIAEMSGRQFFVYLEDDGTGELFYDNRGSQNIVADIDITDDGEADDADGVDVFAAYKTPNAGDHAGQEVYTGGAIRYGDEGTYFEASDVGGSESEYDKWETTWSNDWVENDSQASVVLGRIITNHDETISYVATIDMRPEDAHRIKAGMWIPSVRLRRANKNGTDGIRAVVVTHEPVKPNADGESWYRVTIEMGRPQFSGPMPRGRRSIPRPPTPTVPGEPIAAGRLYYTGGGDATSGLDDTDYSGSWDIASLSSSTPRRLRNTPQDTYANAGSGPSVFSGVGIPAETIVTNMFTCPLTESAGALATVQNGGTWRTVIRSKNRHGVGVNDGAQQNFPTGTIRVFRPGTGFIGTVLDVGDWQASVRFDPGSAYPSIPMSATGAAVASAVSSDYLVVELGADHVAPTSGATGFDYRFADQTTIDDLAFIVDSIANENSWLEGSSSGTTPGTAGDGRSDLIGTSHACYKRCDDTEHFNSALLDDGPRAPTPEDDVDQGFRVGTHWLDDTTGRMYWLTDATAAAAVWVLVSDPTPPPDPGLTIEEIDGVPSNTFDTLKVPNNSLTDNGDGSATVAYLKPVDGGGDALVAHGAMGAAETFDPAEGNWHYGTLDAACTFTLTAPTSGEGCWIVLELTQDSGGGNAITLPASVAEKAALEAAQDTTADGVSFLSLWTRDGGTTWYGAWSGGGSSVVLSDDTPLVESGAGDPGVSDEASRSDHEHPAAGTSGFHYEVLMTGASPAEPLEDGSGTDWLYVLVPD